MTPLLSISFTLNDSVFAEILLKTLMILYELLNCKLWQYNNNCGITCNQIECETDIGLEVMRAEIVKTSVIWSMAFPLVM
ncbi:hypothetical protein T12_3582 [Trichinella patagoniensis]|uniref:Uncharacterized protein n=1 Tax=Trichinella patagoniensis TaxID=990121 RepID=A0A0V0ZFK5_9BILA|nr:hypothetical protein T12_3582 [Trichinella patagoniensis]